MSKKRILDRLVEEERRKERSGWNPGSSPIAKEREKQPINPAVYWVVGIAVVVAGVLAFIFWDLIMEGLKWLFGAIFGLVILVLAMKDANAKGKRRRR